MLSFCITLRNDNEIMLHFLLNSQHNRIFCLWNTQTKLTLFTVNLTWTHTFRVYCTIYYTTFFICVCVLLQIAARVATIHCYNISLYTQIINFAFFYCMSIHSWMINLISSNSVYKLRNYYLLSVAFPDVNSFWFPSITTTHQASLLSTHQSSCFPVRCAWHLLDWFQIYKSIVLSCCYTLRCHKYSMYISDSNTAPIMDYFYKFSRSLLVAM